MPLLELKNSSRLHKDIRLLLDFANPLKFIRRCLNGGRHLKYCCAERTLIGEVRKEENLVRHVLGNRKLMRQVSDHLEFVKDVMESLPFFQGCLCYKSALEPFLNGRKSLEKMNVQEGSLYIESERELVREAVLQANGLPGPIIEVGTLFGSTTAWMAQWKNADKKIITVDNYCWNPWQLSPGSHKLFTHRFLEYLIHRGEVEMVDMDKNAFFESYRGPSPSLVFIDADHSYEATSKDIAWARQIGAKIIAGHDYVEVFGVRRAVDEAGGRCAGADTVWVLNGSAWKSNGEYTLRSAA